MVYSDMEKKTDKYIIYGQYDRDHEFDGQEIIFEIFPEDCPNQVEQGTLSFDAEENAIVTFDDGETMSIKADQVIDTFDNWSKENFS